MNHYLHELGRRIRLGTVDERGSDDQSHDEAVVASDDQARSGRPMRARLVTVIAASLVVAPLAACGLTSSPSSVVARSLHVAQRRQRCAARARAEGALLRNNRLRFRELTQTPPPRVRVGRRAHLEGIADADAPASSTHPSRPPP